MLPKHLPRSSSHFSSSPGPTHSPHPAPEPTPHHAGCGSRSCKGEPAAAAHRLPPHSTFQSAPWGFSRSRCGSVPPAHRAQLQHLRGALSAPGTAHTAVRHSASSCQLLQFTVSSPRSAESSQPPRGAPALARPLQLTCSAPSLASAPVQGCSRPVGCASVPCPFSPGCQVQPPLTCVRTCSTGACAAQEYHLTCGTGAASPSFDGPIRGQLLCPRAAFGLPSLAPSQPP